MREIVALSFVIGLALGVAATLGLTWADCRLYSVSLVPQASLVAQIRALHQNLGQFLTTLDAHPQATLRQTRSFAVRMRVVQVSLHETRPITSATQLTKVQRAGVSLAAAEPTTSSPASPPVSPPVSTPASAPAVSAPKKSAVVRTSGSGARKAVAVSAESERQAYARALRLYESGQYAQARAHFEKFTRHFTHSPLRPNALYWTGETWYAQGRYAQAEAVFQEVSTRFARHPKGADALLKAAYSALRRARPHAARQYLERLQREYAGSHAAALGQQAYKNLPGLASGLETVRG
ncbi:MAG: tol-pal system protein YbgF [Desulfovibrionales bacterium]|nr:tol-pal system protein YbgF [Desulfovibrionales bacterium]